MQQHRIKELIEKLITKTKKGELDWNQTSDQSEFRSIFQSGSITIDDWTINNQSNIVELKIYNDDGNEVDGIQINNEQFIGNEELQETWKSLKELYEIVDNNYYKREETVDSIIDELDRSEDDDIPF